MSDTTTGKRQRRRVPTKPRDEGPSKSEQKAVELQQLLVDKSAALIGSEGFQHWKSILNLSRQRHQYSASNMFLIALQKPDASIVMPYSEWKKAGRDVLAQRDGGQPLYILRPNTRWVTKEDDHGQEQRVKVVTGFSSTHTYDISSTTGPDLPKGQMLQGQAPQHVWDGLVGLAAGEGYTVELGNSGPADGHTNPRTKTITINDARPPLHQLHTLGHEWAHVKLGHVADLEEYRQHRGRMEVEADSGSYVALGLLGLDTSADSVYYVTHWADGDPKKIMETADRVIAFGRETAEAIDPSLRRDHAPEPKELQPKGVAEVTLHGGIE